MDSGFPQKIACGAFSPFPLVCRTIRGWSHRYCRCFRIDRSITESGDSPGVAEFSSIPRSDSYNGLFFDVRSAKTGLQKPPRHDPGKEKRFWQNPGTSEGYLCWWVLIKTMNLNTENCTVGIVISLMAGAMVMRYRDSPNTNPLIP